MNYHVLTLFPEMIEQGLHTSILGRAMEKGLINLEAVDIRDYTEDKHRKVDDYPYGGGAGMVMQAEPVFRACEDVQRRIEGEKARVIYVTPQGKTFDQALAQELAREKDLILLCGHYEGIDERVLEEVVTDYVSIGDYVLTGGELPAMVMIDAISRLVPGVLSNEVSAEFETFHDNLLEYPQYSRPEVWRGKAVPPVLLCGNHDRIEDWRREQSILRTRKRRPDLYESYETAQMASISDKKLSKNRLKLIIADKSALTGAEEGCPERPWAGEFLELIRELDLKLVLLPEEDPKRFCKIMERERVGRREALVFTTTVEGVLAAREERLRTVYLPEDETASEPKELIYYRRISDLLEAMAVLRKLAQ
ncbi:tRNA (guanosine(37)-N1)-methyltransferase TrmD [bacterium 1XD21-13]|nr:tRNA (guanosine(37)-N1)-methyltransferase TrmD [bacterium 1XD21-13]